MSRAAFKVTAEVKVRRTDKGFQRTWVPRYEAVVLADDAEHACRIFRTDTIFKLVKRDAKREMETRVVVKVKPRSVELLGVLE